MDIHKKTLSDAFTHDNTDLFKLTSELKKITLETIQELTEISEIQHQMAAVLAQRFQDNLCAFNKYIPNIYNVFANYKPQRPMEFFCLKNGIPNLIFKDTNDILYRVADPFALSKFQVNNLISRDNISQLKYNHEHDPYGQLHFKYNNAIIEIEESVERDRTISPKDIASIPNCIVLGIGLGYELADLYNQVEIANIIIVEPSLDMFYASLHAFEWAPLLEYLFTNNYGIHIMLGQNTDQFFLDLAKFYDHHGRFLSGTWLGFVHYQTHEVAKIIEQCKKQYSNLHSAMGFFDDHLFGASHCCYALTHHKKFVTKIPLKKEYENVPVFIIGSGPSLDKDLPFIRKNQDKAIIIACGTAIDTLYHAGVKPDFYANTERTPQISQALSIIPDQKFFDDIILFTGDVCHPKTLDLFKHTAIFGKADEPCYPYLTMRLKKMESVQYIQLMNPLVGNMGVSGAIYLGFNKLYLFGLDNGKKIEYDDIHSKHTKLYTDHCLAKGINYRLNKEVPGNFGGKCKTGHYYGLSITNIAFVIEQEKLKRKELVCYNCSDGAFIDYTVPMHSDDLKEYFEHQPVIDKQIFFNYITNEKTAVIDIKENELLKVFSLKNFTSICEKIKAILHNRSETRLGFIKNMETVSEVLNYLKNAQITFFDSGILEGSLQTMFASATRALYHSKDEKICIELENKIMDVIEDFLTECPEIYAHLPDYCLDDHRKYYPDNKVGRDLPHCKATPLPDRQIIIKKDIIDTQQFFVKRYD